MSSKRPPWVGRCLHAMVGVIYWSYIYIYEIRIMTKSIYLLTWIRPGPERHF